MKQVKKKYKSPCSTQVISLSIASMYFMAPLVLLSTISGTTKIFSMLLLIALLVLLANRRLAAANTTKTQVNVTVLAFS